MRIPLQFYDSLRNIINLSNIVRTKVNLTKKAGEYIGLCPFHSEKSPSFTVSDIKKFYHCFGCGAHGDVIKFNAEILGLSYKDSAIKLACEHGIDLPKLSKEQESIYEESDQISNILELATEFFKCSHNQESLKYLSNRKIDKNIIQNFNIGFAPSGGKLQQFFESKSIPLLSLVKAGLAGKRDDGKIYEIFHDRIMFPIKNIYNKVIAFGGRVIGDGLPKYINSPETLVFKKNETLYGENDAMSHAYRKNYIIIVEGYLDVIALHRAGYCATVASLGTAVTEGHLSKLWRSIDEIIICLDGDSAGHKASHRVINVALPLITYNKKISFIILPAGSDPDDVIAKENPQYFDKLIEKRVSLSEMIWNYEYNGKNYFNAESRALLESNLQSYCKIINDKILSKNYHRFFQEQIWQNLVKRQPKSKNVTNNSQALLSDLKDKYHEIDILERAFCQMVIKFPCILNDEEVKNFITELNFRDSQLSDFRDWFITKHDQDQTLNFNYIEENVKNTRFYNTFILLIKPENLFPYKSLNENNDPKIIWGLIYKKYYLISLKQEFTAIMQSGFEDAFERAVSYQKEIAKISKELQKLNESFFNY